MSERERRARHVWLLWMARGLGYGALGLVALGFLFYHQGPGFFLVGVVLGLVALVIGVPAGLRVKKLQEEDDARAGGAGRAAGGFALGCATLVGTLLLLSWLLPSHVWPGGHDRRRAYKAFCLLNVKQIALALQLYLADNGDVFPPAAGWCESLEEYTPNEQTFQCPEARDLRCGYAYNRALSGARLRDLTNPRTTVAVFESGVGWNAAGDASILPVAPRHLEGDNYGCADGRGLWVKREELALGDAEIGWSVQPAS